MSFALVLGGWAGIAASNDDAGVDAVATAEESPLEVEAQGSAADGSASSGIGSSGPALDDSASGLRAADLPVPGAAAAARATAATPRAVPAAVLYRAPVCAGAKGAAPDEAVDALQDAAAAINVLGADYPEVYSGLVACKPAARLIVYRVPDVAFDAAIRTIADREQVTIKLAKAAFSRQELDAMKTWLDSRRADFAARGLAIRAVSLKPNGTVEVSVDSADVTAAAKRLQKFRAQVRVVPYTKR